MATVTITIEGRVGRPPCPLASPSAARSGDPGGGSKATRARATATATQAKLTRSELEAWFLHLVRAIELPQPVVNHILSAPDHPRLEVDFCWPQHHLIVELDGWDTYHTKAAFTHDRRKDAAPATIQHRLQALMHH
jgi:very-short-patch-repair endonuclease